MLVKSLVAAATALAGVAAVFVDPAEAISLGDSVNGTLTAVGEGTLLDQTQTVTDPGFEFSFFGILSLDIKEGAFDIIYNLTGFSNTGAGTIWTLTGLENITGVILTSGDTNLIQGYSFTDNSITVAIKGYYVPPESIIETWSFNVLTEPAGIPWETDAAAAVSLLLGSALVYRRAQKSA
jgi:hypothetical protein